MLEQIIVGLSVNKYKDLYGLEDKDDNYNYNSSKKILFYTPFFSNSDYSFGFGNKPFVENECLVTNCITTNDRNSLSKLYWLLEQPSKL